LITSSQTQPAAGSAEDLLELSLKGTSSPSGEMSAPSDAEGLLDFLSGATSQ